MAPVVGIVGYGRFGAALARLVQESGLRVCAVDPAARIPDRQRARDVASLVRRSEIIVLCVPVPATREAALALRPYLDGSHLVLDAGSVKTGPMEAMRHVLGDAIPWAGTHPLFGPTSLALGERPLRVVLCADAAHRQSARRARAFFEGIGCSVIEREAEEHDRVLAESHALTYFIAKGVLDAGFVLDPDLAPPSSQAIARAVEAVRADAGHLFWTLQHENPFAHEVRRRFQDALAAIERTLECALREGDDTSSPLAIPDLGQRSPELRAVRDLIDDVDRDLLSLLARRAALVRRAGDVKAELGSPVYDARREADLLTLRDAWARELGLPESPVRDVFLAVLRLSRGLQQRDPAT